LGYPNRKVPTLPSWLMNNATNPGTKLPHSHIVTPPPPSLPSLPHTPHHHHPHTLPTHAHTHVPAVLGGNTPSHDRRTSLSPPIGPQSTIALLSNQCPSLAASFPSPPFRKNSNRLDGPGYRVISLSANAPFILAFGGLFLGLFAASNARDSLPDARPSHGILVRPLS